MYPSHNPIKLLIIASLLLSPSAFAKDEIDIEEDVVITADKASFHQNEGWGMYSGNAELEQGQRKVNADKIKLYVDKNGDLERVEAEGNPVKMRDGDEISARGGLLVYEVKTNTITLSKKAYINNEGRTFEGPKVTYNLTDRNVEADGEESGERVRLTIPANKKDKK